VLSGPAKKYFSRDEADQLAAEARAEADVRARQSVEAKGFAAVDRIVVNLATIPRSSRRWPNSSAPRPLSLP